MNYNTILRWLAIGWTIVILIGCLTPHAKIPSTINDINDKLMHVVIFAPFALLWLLAGLRFNMVLLAGLALGAFVEVLQYILPINRSADWIDLFADGVGTLTGAVLAQIWYRFFPNRNF